MIQKLNNIKIEGSSGKSILIDVFYKQTNTPKKIVVFSHGFKGFKDWGPFNDIATYFAKQDFVFVKFNFSHNGTTIANPSEFDDLKAFGDNNFCKELDDLGFVLDWIEENKELSSDIDVADICLYGHSRGGSISILKSFEDSRVKQVVSWASPSNFIDRLPKGEKLQKWKENNVAYIFNGRTKQNMPMYYQFYESCIANSNRLDIKNAVSNLNIPHLVVHGSDDPTVLISEAQNFKSWNNDIDLHIIDGANHVLGGFHPYDLDKFPKDLKEAIDVTIDFLKR